MDTSVSNAVPPAVSEVEIPARMFFDAKDYAPHAKPRTKPTPDQANVARARGELLGDVHRIHERLAVAIKHIRVADACGMATSSVDVLLATAQDFMSTVQRLMKTSDNAETRFELAIAQGPAAQPETKPKPILEYPRTPIIGPGMAARMAEATKERKEFLAGRAAVQDQATLEAIDAATAEQALHNERTRLGYGGRP